MRRIWAAVLSAWALLAIVGVLAWTHPPTQPPSGRATVVVLKNKHGRTVLLRAGLATHTTTHSSPAAGGG